MMLLRTNSTIQDPTQSTTNNKFKTQMASHHHHPAAAVSSCYCNCCHPTYIPCRHQYHPPPPPPDPHLHHHQDLPHLYPPVSHPRYPQHFQENYIQERTQPHPTVASLLRRIAALESALRRRSSSFHSLRDAAARTIQAQFRAFLVRRSKTLRMLKDLALIKSNLGFLKSSVSRKTHFDYDAIYQKAVNLLLKLDAIQGGDPMIRNGKRTLNKELQTFLDFIEGACVQSRIVEVNVKHSGDNVRTRVSSSEKKRGIAESGGLKRINVEKLKGLVERIDRLAEGLNEEQCQEFENPKDEFVMVKYGASPNSSGGGLVKQNLGGIRPKVKKNVSFAENGNVYRVLKRESHPYLEECSNASIDNDDIDYEEEEQELVDDLCRELEEIGVSTKEDVEDGSSSSENGERHSSKGRGNFGTKLDQDDNGDFVFSAPLPAKMERRSN